MKDQSISAKLSKAGRLFLICALALGAPGSASAEVSLGGWLAHSPDDISGFATLTGNDATTNATMPFSVTIEGTSYNTVAISTNGWLEFGGNTQGTAHPGNVCLPTATHTNPLLAAYWDDLNPFGTTIRYGTVGSSPNRTFIVDYEFDVDPANEGGGADDGRMQVQVHERSNLITVKYRELGDLANGQSATIGFQGAGGASSSAQPLTCNGKILDDNRPDEGWSIDAGHAGLLTLAALIEHSPDDIPGTFTTLSGNDSTANVTLPFSINIEGTNYNTVAISTNGWMELGGNTSGNSDPTNDCLPSPVHTNPLVAMYWDDMQTINTAMRYGTVGTSPNRTFIVDFDIETTVGTDDGQDDVTGQVQIHERSGLINVRYNATQNMGNGQNATIGFQGDGGASARAYGLTCNGKVLDDNQAPSEGWSVHPKSLGAMSTHAVLAHSPDDIPGGFTTLSGNDATANATMPFNVRIDGVNYNTVGISTNGWMEFGGNTSGNSDPTNDCLPTSAHTNPFLAPYWDDMSAASTNVRYGSVGTSPSRTFIADFFLDTVTSPDDGADDVLFQVEVHEGSNVISVKYRESQLHANGQNATIGYQGAGGASATAHPLTCNGKVLDDNRVHTGWSIAPLPICGNGILETAEACDQGAANGTPTSCCTSTCGFRAPGQECRASVDECDAADTCSGSNGTCGADLKVTGGTPCTDDGNVCTNDQCNGTANACQHPNNSAPCSDGVFCNGADTCSGGTCSIHPGDPCEGPDGDGNCSESCDEAADDCLAADTDGTSCADGLFCNGADTCAGGSCDGHAGDPCAGNPECADACDESLDSCLDPPGTLCTPDGNGCTDELCNGAGACANVPNSAPCDDGLFCTGTDTCGGGSCSLHTGDPCPGADGDGDCAESCDEGADSCNAADTDGSPCTDGVFCNGADTCAAGTCTTHAGDPCASGSECADACEEVTDSCNDVSGTPCTDDGNVCSDDECDGAGACAHPDNSEPCDDGLFCNGADTCANSNCEVHAGDPCTAGTECADACNETADDCNDLTGTACTDDGNTCSDDECDGAGACGHPANSLPCDDTLFCNGTDTCDASTCSLHTGDPCAGGTECADACNEAGDDCNGDAFGLACTDDGNLCTDDTCDGSGVCVHTNNSAPCSDGDACTVNDTCAGGACVSGPAADCDDGSPCTDDSCDSGSGCVNEAAPFDEAICFIAAKAGFQIKDKAGDTLDQIKWKRAQGEGYSHARLGDPSTTATYTLCIFDQTAGVPILAGSLTIEPNQSWVDKNPKGWTYVDKAGTRDGIQKLQLGAGVPEKAKMQLKARGRTASWPAPIGGSSYFDLDTAVIVQLSNDETGDCWSTTFTQARKNDASQFNTKFTIP